MDHNNASPVYFMQQNDSGRNASTIPDRIMVAMGFIHAMHVKEAGRTYEENGIRHEQPGLPVTILEEATRSAACNVLKKYFDGSLKINIFELTEINSASSQINQQLNKMVIQCPQCRGRRENGNGGICLCVGSGFVAVSPYFPSVADGPHKDVIDQGASNEPPCSDPDGSQAAAPDVPDVSKS